MRQINLIIIHASASDNPSQDNIEAIRHLHTAPKTEAIQWGRYATYGRSWQDIGYHFCVSKKSIEIGRPEHQVGAHCKGFNSKSIGVVFSGDKIFSAKQMLMGAILIQGLIVRYELEVKDVVPHSLFNKYKTCPNFDVNELVKRGNV